MVYNKEYFSENTSSDSQPLLSVVMDVTKYSVHTTRNWQIESLYLWDPLNRILIMYL